jgi:hypothetical protein
VAEFTPYSSAVPFYARSGAPAGVAGLDAERLRAYDLYEQFYWNHPECFKLIIRGEDAPPRYLPAAREIIEATNRYLASAWNYTIEGKSQAERGALDLLVRSLFKRENMYMKFAAQRRNGLIRGDAIWHITADPAKPLGQRVSLHEVHPGQHFYIEDPNNVDRILGIHLVDAVPDPRDSTKVVARRQTYRKNLDETGTVRGITTELTLWDWGKWDDRTEEARQRAKLVQVLRPAEPLPPTVTQLPLYHIRNTYDSRYHYGSSELRGIETVLAATQQAVTDQDLAVAIGGLGIWVTTAGPPKDIDGNLAPWEFGPLRVAEIPDGSILDRRGQLDNITPSVQHLDILQDRMRAGLGVPDVAAGKVDVSVAESGISLALQLSPLLKKNEEKEQSMLGTYDQMFFDLLHMWLPAYEQFIPGPDLELLSVVGDAVPRNRVAEVAEVIQLYTAKLITFDMAVTRLAEYGYEFPANAEQQINAAASAAALAADPFGARADTELANATSSGSENGTGG